MTEERKEIASLNGKTISKVTLNDRGNLNFHDHNGEIIFMVSYYHIFDGNGMFFDMHSLVPYINR